MIGFFASTVTDDVVVVDVVLVVTLDDVEDEGKSDDSASSDLRFLPINVVSDVDVVTTVVDDFIVDGCVVVIVVDAVAAVAIAVFESIDRTRFSFLPSAPRAGESDRFLEYADRKALTRFAIIRSFSSLSVFLRQW